MAEAGEVVALAEAVVDVAKKFKQARSLMGQVLDSNTAQAINWGALTTELDSKDYDGSDISNAIGSLAAFDAAWWNTHGQNMQLITPPIV